MGKISPILWERKLSPQKENWHVPGGLARKIQSLDLNPSQPESRAFALNSRGDQKISNPQGWWF